MLSEPQPSSGVLSPAFFTLNGTTATWWRHILPVEKAPQCREPERVRAPIAGVKPLTFLWETHQRPKWTLGVQHSLVSTGRKASLCPGFQRNLKEPQRPRVPTSVRCPQLKFSEDIRKQFLGYYGKVGLDLEKKGSGAVDTRTVV